MDATFLFVRLLLATVFLVSALAKLADPKGSKQALIDFGIPILLAHPLVLLLPLSEFFIAIVLISSSTAWWGAIGALGMFVIFSLAIAFNLVLGRNPECHCFGRLHSTPIGWSTLLRNSILGALAGAVLWHEQYVPGIGLSVVFVHLTTSEIVSLSTTLLVLLIFAVSGRLFVLHIPRQQGRSLLRIEMLEQCLGIRKQLPLPTPVQPTHGLPVGTLAPHFQLPGLYGETLNVGDLCVRGNQVLLVFSDPDCGVCNALLHEVAFWQDVHGSKLTVVLISRGKREENEKKSTHFRLINVLLQQDREVAASYHVHRVPAAVLVSLDGKIASPVAVGSEAIRKLIAHVVGQLVRDQLPTATRVLRKV